jgi:ribonuclease HII
MLRFETGLQDRGYSRVAGLDEAGRGPLAGPVVAAAVILPMGTRYEGLTDSKLLRPEQREHWFDQIREVALDYAIASVSEQEIDEINILVASRKAMELALKGLSLHPDHLLVDGIIPLETSVPQHCVKKGDRRSQSIAAASILAKVTRDRLMLAFHEQYPHYNFKKNKGYGTREHLDALRRFGCCPLHRKSFRGVKDLQSRNGKTPPSELFSDPKNI